MTTTNVDYSSMDQKYLSGLLMSKYGFRADENIPKQTLIDQLNKLDTENEKSAEETNRKALTVYNAIFDANKIDKETLVHIRFKHHDGDTEVKFRYFAQDRYVDDKGITKMIMPTYGKGDSRQWKFSPPQWHFISGHSYKVPFSVYEHLNSRIVPDAVIEIDPTTGQERSRPVLRSRMSAELHMTREQVERANKTGPALKQGA